MKRRKLENQEPRIPPTVRPGIWRCPTCQIEYEIEPGINPPCEHYFLFFPVKEPK